LTAAEARITSPVATRAAEARQVLTTQPKPNETNNEIVIDDHDEYQTKKSEENTNTVDNYESYAANLKKEQDAYENKLRQL